MSHKPKAERQNEAKRQRLHEGNEKAVAPRHSGHCHIRLHKLGVKEAGLHGSSYDLPFRGLPRELRDEIYRYALCVPKLKQTHSSSEHSIGPGHCGPTSPCKITLNYGPVYFPYQCPSRMTTYIPNGLEFLSVNRQMSKEAAAILYRENTFHFSSCCESQLKGFTKALRPASHTALQHIAVDRTCAFTGIEDFMLPFIQTLRAHFRLETLTLSVRINGGTDLILQRLPQLWEPPQMWNIGHGSDAFSMFSALDAYLKSGSVKALRWVWQKLGYDDGTMGKSFLPLHQSRPVNLVHLEATRFWMYSGRIETLQQFQEMLDRQESGNQRDEERSVVKFSTKWESSSVLRMWPKIAGDSDRETLDAMREIVDAKFGYEGLLSS